MRELPIGASIEPVNQAVADLVANGNSKENAQSEIAASHGFLTWRQLTQFLDIGRAEDLDFDHLACLNYAWWENPKRMRKAEAMFADDPSLERRSIYSACTAGNVGLVEEFLARDPDLLNQRGGYFDWEPLLYACYSRINLPDRSTSDVVQFLIEKGADPNAHYRWGGIYVFSALTGVFGEGERGPVNQPRHPDCENLVGTLLDAGADCNDSQALYNRMFQPDNSALITLIDAGLSSTRQCNWYETVDEELISNRMKTLDYQLQWAVKRNFTERVDILTQHGADVSQNLPSDGGSLVRIARTRGFNQVADILERHGAEPYKLSAVEAFLNHCLSANGEQAESLLTDDPELIDKANKHDANAMNQAAELGNIDAIELMLDLGFSVHGEQFDTPIHNAAHNGHLELVKYLIDHGADIHRRDAFYLSSPHGWAQAGNKHEVMRFLETLDLGIFDLINADAGDRIESLLNESPDLLERTLGDEVPDDLKGHENAWQTPLAYAAVRDRVDIVKLLLRKGAIKQLFDTQGKSLVEYCNDEIRSLVE